MKKKQTFPWITDWNARNPRLKWAGLSNDERTMIRVSWQTKNRKPVPAPSTLRK